MGEIRLGEATTPLLDKVVAKIKTDLSAATAKSCCSVISGVLGSAVRYGAIMLNPVRDIDRIESNPKNAPRALTPGERVDLLNAVAGGRDSPDTGSSDVVFFMLATGDRIGEAMAVVVGGRLRSRHDPRAGPGRSRSVSGGRRATGMPRCVRVAR